MAKCSICTSRKGKRKCKVDGTFVCTLCCGQSRSPDKCTGCSFFKDASASRNYRKLPFYETYQMSNSMDLQDISNVIESVFCRFDLYSEGQFTDSKAARLLELLFDKYHFKDSEFVFKDPVLEENFKQMLQIISEDLPNISNEELIKVSASIYRSVQRRTNGGKEYLHFTQQYVGARVGLGARVIHRDNI